MVPSRNILFWSYALLTVGMFVQSAMAAENSAVKNPAISGRRLPADFLKQFKVLPHSSQGFEALTGRNKQGLDRCAATSQFSQPEYDSVPYWTGRDLRPNAACR